MIIVVPPFDACAADQHLSSIDTTQVSTDKKKLRSCNGIETAVFAKEAGNRAACFGWLGFTS